MDVVAYQYLTSLGHFTIEELSGKEWDFYLWAIFVFSSFLFNVIVINLMIATACDTYDRVSSENREINSLQKKVTFLADYVFDSDTAQFGYKTKYIFTMKPLR